MTEQPSTLPFLYREILPSRHILLSNTLGSHVLLPSSAELRKIVRGDISDLPPALVEELFAKSFLSEAGELNMRSSLLASGLATSMSRALAKPGLFMIVPTLRCDHDCRYCQVSRAPLKARGVDASLERIPAILSCIRAVMGATAKIEFQGGEPLLGFEFIREFVTQAEQALIGKRISYVICSALGPLNDAMVDWAKSRDIVFSVSLDGDRSSHNSNRPSRYFDSHHDTVTKVRRLLRELGSERVSGVATVTRQTLSRPTQLADAYFAEGLSSLFVRPLAPFGFALQMRKSIGYDPREYGAFFEKVLRCVIDMNGERQFVEESTLLRLRRIYDPGFSGSVDMQSPAGFLLGALVFNYDGQVFGSDEARMLWESTRVKELTLGAVEESADRLFRNAHAANLLTDTFTPTMPGCDECAYQPFCGADPLHHLATQGDHVGDKSMSFFCQIQRILFDQLFSLLEDPHARKVFESWLRR